MLCRGTMCATFDFLQGDFMQVTITRIDREDVQVNEHTHGFWAVFSCPLTVGSAIIVGNKNNFAQGETIDVETSFERISTWAILPESSSPRMSPLVERGDYQVTGKVDMTWEDGVISIDADFHFMLDAGRDTTPNIGQWVTFNVHRLILWPYYI